MVPSHAHDYPRQGVPPARRQLAFAAVATLALLGPATISVAQTALPATRADPLNAAAPVPPLAHLSAFTKYRRLIDTPVGSWRDANDTVTRIGGWRAYAREASLPHAPSAAPAAAPPAGAAGTPGDRPAEPAPALPPGPGGHHDHKTK